MTNQKPKFCVGEEVMIQSVSCPDMNGNVVEVTKCVWATSDDNLIPRWVYFTVGMYTPWEETALRKLPPEDRISWEDCAFNPIKESV